MSEGTVYTEAVQCKPSVTPGSKFLSPISFKKKKKIAIAILKRSLFISYLKKRKSLEPQFV